MAVLNGKFLTVCDGSKIHYIPTFTSSSDRSDTDFNMGIGLPEAGTGYYGYYRIGFFMVVLMSTNPLVSLSKSIRYLLYPKVFLLYGNDTDGNYISTNYLLHNVYFDISKLTSIALHNFIAENSMSTAPTLDFITSAPEYDSVNNITVSMPDDYVERNYQIYDLSDTINDLDISGGEDLTIPVTFDVGGINYTTNLTFDNGGITLLAYTITGDGVNDFSVDCLGQHDPGSRLNAYDYSCSNYNSTITKDLRRSMAATGIWVDIDNRSYNSKAYVPFNTNTSLLTARYNNKTRWANLKPSVKYDETNCPLNYSSASDSCLLCYNIEYSSGQTCVSSCYTGCYVTYIASDDTCTVQAEGDDLWCNQAGTCTVCVGGYNLSIDIDTGSLECSSGSCDTCQGCDSNNDPVITCSGTCDTKQTETVCTGCDSGCDSTQSTVETVDVDIDDDGLKTCRLRWSLTNGTCEGSYLINNTDTKYTETCESNYTNPGTICMFVDDNQGFSISCESGYGSDTTGNKTCSAGFSMTYEGLTITCESNYNTDGTNTSCNTNYSYNFNILEESCEGSYSVITDTETKETTTSCSLKLGILSVTTDYTIEGSCDNNETWSSTTDPETGMPCNENRTIYKICNTDRSSEIIEQWVCENGEGVCNTTQTETVCIGCDTTDASTCSSCDGDNECTGCDSGGDDSTCSGCYLITNSDNTIDTSCNPCYGTYSQICIGCQSNCQACNASCYASQQQCSSCDACETCESCDTCQSCNTCDSCDTCQTDNSSSCSSCNSCQGCDSCQSCDECQSCDSSCQSNNGSCKVCNSGCYASCQSCDECQGCDSCQKNDGSCGSTLVCVTCYGGY